MVNLARHHRWPAWLIAVASLLPAARLAAEERLVDLPPFDVIVLNAANNNAELKVKPLAERRMPAQPQGDLQISLVADPTQPLAVPWSSIREVRFYEQSLLAEAQRLTRERKFDEAFDYFARLNAEYSNLAGVDAATSDYLRANALALFQAQQLDRALAVLMSLYDRAPESPGLAGAVDAICGRMIEQSLRQQDYAAARAVLEMWQSRFASLNSPAVVTWQQRFETAAQRQLAEARQLLAAKEYAAARKAIGRAHDIWPTSPEVASMRAEMQRAYPAVSVGVFEPAPRRPVRRIDDWASLRASWLVEPLVAELVDFSSEGGVYESAYGDWVPDETGLRLSLKLKPRSERGPGFPTADRIARSLLHAADPQRVEYRPAFAELLAGVSVDGEESIHLTWKRPHVRPESLLQFSIAADADSDGTTAEAEVIGVAPRFQIAAADSASTVFGALPLAGGRQPAVGIVVEQTMANEESAIAALLHGEIDALDRVPPWQVERLRTTEGIRVESYRLPTVHVLVPNPQKPLAASREFRRAVCFAIDRERIVREVLLGGSEAAGFQVLSGPFPAGLSFSDPLRYAYNNQLAPRAFEPRLSAVLATVAWSKQVDPNGEQDVALAELPTLVLAHPRDPVARVACETIKLQLARAGIPVELREFTADELADGSFDYDLRYAELAVWEPLADARVLVGKGGLAGDSASPYLESVLRRLDGLTNWKDVRATMSEIHDIAYHDLPVVPLWQTVNYFAYRAALQGVGQSPVTLYQNIDDWSIDSAMPDAGTASVR